MAEGKENPFIKGSEQEQEKSKAGRKPITPNFGQVVRAVERGEYDEDLHQLTEAIRSRHSARQEHVMAMVRDVFGSDAVVEFTKGMDGNASFTRSRVSEKLFEKTAEDGEESEESEIADETSADPLEHLDEVEQKMVQDEAAPDSPAPASNVPIEQRGAVISGLGPSDMGQ